MKNAEFDSRDVKRCCETKLDITFRDGKHFSGWVYIGETKAARITVPKGRQSIPKGTYKSMARQLKITTIQFDDLLECPLKRGDYEAILKPPTPNATAT